MLIKVAAIGLIPAVGGAFIFAGAVAYSVYADKSTMPLIAIVGLGIFAAGVAVTASSALAAFIREVFRSKDF